AETPRRSSSFFTSCAASSSDSPTIESSNCCKSAISVLRYFEFFPSFVIRKPSLQCASILLPRQTTRQIEPAQPLTLITKNSAIGISFCQQSEILLSVRFPQKAKANR